MLHVLFAFFLAFFAEIVCCQTPYELVRGTPYNVSYDHRAFTINGERQLFHVGTVHYPRATPEMWPGIMERSVAGGINLIDTYVFWNYHEFEKGVYDFETENRNLVEFIEVAAEYGLFVTLRIGPYVCAEWTLGGIPSWLMEEDDMVFRTYNEGWIFYMEQFTREVVDRVRHQLPSQGGPIILLQIENEYGHFTGQYGQGGKDYVEWMGEVAYEIEDEIPWIMCEQPDAPINLVETKNGYYADNWLAGHFASGRNQPGAWTENWPGWFQNWGDPVPHRAPEDIAFAVARWFQRGGTYQTYYMWFGGTTFGRWVGGPYIITSYDYDVALNEYGFMAQPKFGHLTDLHRVLDEYAQALLYNEVPPAIQLGSEQEAHIWGEIGTPGSVVFLGNYAIQDAEIQFNGYDWLLPAWSVLIVDGGDGATPVDVVFDTSKHDHPTEIPEPLVLQQFRTIRVTEEPVGGFTTPIVNESPLSQLPITQDRTDYMWYSTVVTADSTQGILAFDSVENYVFVFVDGNLVGEGRGPEIEFLFEVTVGQHELDILTMSMGFWNYGMYLERVWEDRGINGNVQWQGTSISNNEWIHRPGLRGEELNFPETSETAEWSTEWETEVSVPMRWFEIDMNMPEPNPALGYSLLITTMGKGAVWVNGNMLGRFWNIIATGQCDEVCDYRGPYNAGKCRSGCGEPSQSHYHLPREWMTPGGGVNRIVLFTENGGNPAEVRLAYRTEEPDV